jgi:hypothetical protein
VISHFFIIPGAAFKMPFDRAQAPELSGDIFYGFDGIAGCAAMTGASS